MPFSVYESLSKKRRGEALSDFEIESFISGFTSGEIPDYQMSALLMAIAIRGMEPRETATLVQSMLRSGEQWNLRERYDFVGDKHSTGGVGDKISLALAPWVAACGVKVAMLSGRGLGHTGGTLDKLDSIAGFNARLSRDEIDRCLDEVGCVIATSTRGIAPADRKMYALRDVTATVESLPLITASIMSKKLALGATGLILDVKTGRGAFMKTIDDSRALARSLITASAGSSTRVEALITDMSRPLGRAVGNANEVLEAIDVLRGKGPADIHELTKAQGARLLVMSGRFDAASAAAKLDEVLRSGAALEHARKWIAAQGGEPAVVDSAEYLPMPSAKVEARAQRSGYIASINPYATGMLAIDLGAGRKRADDAIDYAAGIQFEKCVGDEVRAGDVIARLEASRTAIDDSFATRLLEAIRITDGRPDVPPLIYEHIT